MVHNEALNLILTQLLRRNLGEAISAMDNFLAIYPHQVNADRLFAIKSDYQLMADYWRRGFKDPQLPNLYDTLLKRMYVLYANIANSYDIRHMSLLSSLYYRSHTAARDWAPQNIREELESFVSEVAMLELEAPHTAEPKRKELYARHHRSMVELFDYILTSGMWTDGFSSAMEEMLLSPTVDTGDQQLIVTAVMLAAINCFDITKFRLLVHLYQKAIDEPVRQRALVGWAFALDTGIGQSIYPEQKELVEKLQNDSDTYNYIIAPACVYTRLQFPLKEIADTIIQNMRDPLTGDTVKWPYVNKAEVRVSVENKFTGSSSDKTYNDWIQPASNMLLIREESLERFFLNRELPSDTCALLGTLTQGVDSVGDAIYYYSYDMSDFLTDRLHKILRERLYEVNNNPTLNMLLVPVTIGTSTVSNSATAVTSVRQQQTVSATKIRSAKNGMKLEIVYSGF